MVLGDDDGFGKGDLVRLAGLVSKPELNGTEARLLSWGATRGRWNADVGGQVVSLKPECIRPAARRAGPRHAAHV